MSETNTLVKDYEVFKNDKNALAFFVYRQPELDQNDKAGPFSFSIHDDNIHAGTESHNVIFADVDQDIISIARTRGVIMMMEFEGQTPVRCTPCYLSDTL